MITFEGARDLTAAPIRRRQSERAMMAHDYRDARDAYDLTMESVAIGYATEEREFRANNPAPTWRKFLEGYAR